MSRNDLTAERLDELLALAERATPGKREAGREWDEGLCPCLFVGKEVDEFGDRIRAMTDEDLALAAACDPDTIRSYGAVANIGIAVSDPPPEIKAVINRRFNRVRVSEDDATAVVDWLTSIIMPEPS